MLKDSIPTDRKSIRERAAEALQEEQRRKDAEAKDQQDRLARLQIGQLQELCRTILDEEVRVAGPGGIEGIFLGTGGFPYAVLDAGSGLQVLQYGDRQLLASLQCPHHAEHQHGYMSAEVGSLAELGQLYEDHRTAHAFCREAGR